MSTAEHHIEGGWILVERDVDLRGRVHVFGIYYPDGTPSAWETARTPTGWRARLASNGYARRALKGPAWESAPQTVRYLVKYSYLSLDRRPS